MGQIIITKISAESDSAIVFEASPRSQIRRHQNRVSITPTLDGGAVLDAQGYSIGDRRLVIRASLTEETADKLWAHFKSELYSNISTNDGFFFGSINDIEIDRGQTVINFLVKE
jgi:hypothetical protein